MNKRSELLAIATSLFGLHGYREVTTRQICDAANCNIASLFYHFSNKESLYQECLNQLIFNPDLCFDKILLAPETKEDFDAAFDSFEGAFNQFVQDNLSSLKLLLNSIDLGFRTFFEEKFLKPTALQMETFLAKSQQKGIVSPDLDIKTTSRTIVNFLMCHAILRLTETEENHGEEGLSREILKGGILNYHKAIS